MSIYNLPVMSADLNFGDELYSLLGEVQQSGTYTNFGPQVRAYERELADFLGADPDHLVTAANATLGIAGAMTILEAAEWVMPSWTFAASAHAALQATSNVVFGDVDLETNVLETAEVASGRSALITAPFGAGIKIGEEWNPAPNLVIDAAAAIASPPQVSKEYRGKWAMAFSLHSTKLLGVGEGAVVVFSDAELARKFKSWTNFGFSGSRTAAIRGTNAKMSEIHAAIGRSRLRAWGEEKPDWIAARGLADEVATRLGINVAYSRPDWISPYWIVQFGSQEAKAAVAGALGKARIESRDWWASGCQEMAPFRGIPASRNLANSRLLAETTLGLPFFRRIGQDDVQRISEVISENL
jgi:dTDP-4-amino-4,6-dideoxygalactose transaminase